MASSQSTLDFLLDVLSDSRQVSAHRMFGEFCLYYAGRPVGLVCNEQLFLKPSEMSTRLMQESDSGAQFPGARLHLRISPELWDDRNWMTALIHATYASLPPPKVARSRPAKPQQASQAAMTKRKKRTDAT
jgi:TfoX/Sxy family transcriptional regulator of competence genes